MDDFLFSFNVVAPMFILMAAGYLTRKIKFASPSFLSQMNRFVFQLCLPIMLFQDIRLFYRGDFSNLRLIFSAVVGILIIIIFSFMIVPLVLKKKGQRGSMIQAIYRSNFLIYGLPLATGMYGEQAIPSVSMLMGIMIPLYNVAAVIILSIFSEDPSKKISFLGVCKSIATNPLIIGSALGLLGGMIHLRFPYFIEHPLEQLAIIASPLALFVMGGEFSFGSLRSNIRKALIATIFRVMIIPVIAIAIFIWMGFRGIELSVLLCIFATPTAIASYIMAENMHNDGQLSAQIVVLTTSFSCATIFLFIYYLRNMGYL
jgi:predicted permease